MHQKIKLIENFIVKNQHFVQNVLLGLILLACSWSLFYSGLGVGHDLNHQARIFEMARGLTEGVFPVIWSQNFVFGYGMPLFEFYAPLPYYFGAVFYLLGASLTLSVKLMIFTANLITLLGSFWLGKKLFKNSWAAVLLTAAILLAPYRSVDLYIRAAISEGWAIGFLVWTLLGIVLVTSKQRLSWLVLSLSLAGLVLSHNLTALMSLPFITIFGLGLVLIYHKNWPTRLHSYLVMFLSGLLALSLASFYFLPALLEKRFTQIDTYTLSSYFDYRQHFLYIRQLFEPWGAWEYGGSGWGPNDEMSYFLGFGQIFGLIFGLFQLVFLFVLKRKSVFKKPIFLLQILVFLLLATSLFLTLLKAQKIWELFAFSVYFQFPWRLLSLSLIFIGLIIAGSFLLIKKDPLKKTFFMLTFALLIAFNTRYFRSEKYLDYSDQYLNYAQTIRSKTSEILYDYLPKNIDFIERMGFYAHKKSEFSDLEVPTESLFSTQLTEQLLPRIIKDQSTQKIFTVNLSTPTSVSLSLAYYPGWQATSNNQPIELNPNQRGLIELNLPAGQNHVELKLKDTPIRFWSKIISVATIIFVVLNLIFYKFCYVYPYQKSSMRHLQQKVI